MPVAYDLVALFEFTVEGDNAGDMRKSLECIVISGEGRC